MAEDTVLPRASIVPVPMAGEPPSDRAFACAEDGRAYRVRFVEIVQPDGPVVMTFQRVFDISVVRLADDGLPERNAADQVVIVAATRWTLDAEAVSNPGGLSIEAQLDLLVGNLIHRARLTADAPAAIDAMLANWSALV